MRPCISFRNVTGLATDGDDHVVVALAAFELKQIPSQKSGNSRRSGGRCSKENCFGRRYLDVRDWRLKVVREQKNAQHCTAYYHWRQLLNSPCEGQLRHLTAGVLPAATHARWHGSMNT